MMPQAIFDAPASPVGVAVQIRAQRRQPTTSPMAAPIKDNCLITYRQQVFSTSELAQTGASRENTIRPSRPARAQRSAQRSLQRSAPPQPAAGATSPSEQIPLEDNYPVISGLSDLPQVFSTSITIKEERRQMIKSTYDKTLLTNAMVESDFCSADTQRLKTDYLAAQKVLNIPYHYCRVRPCYFRRMSRYIVFMT